jgi:hypothetical protein
MQIRIRRCNNKAREAEWADFQAVIVRRTCRLYGRLYGLQTALSNPGSFGIMKLQFTANGTLTVVQFGSNFNYEVGIAQVPLERKKFVLDRLSTLKSDEKIGTAAHADRSIREMK